MNKYITIINNENEVVLSYLGTISETEPVVINNNYTQIISNDEPIFTEINERKIKYYPNNQKEKL